MSEALPAEESSEAQRDEDLVEESLLLLRVGASELAIYTHLVRSVVADDLVRTQIPGAPGHILGVINHRGAAVAVFDLATYLGLGSGEDSPRLVIAQAAGMTAAIPVTQILGIRRARLSALQPGDTNAIRHALGVAQVQAREGGEAHPVYVLDLPGLLQTAAARA